VGVRRRVEEMVGVAWEMGRSTIACVLNAVAGYTMWLGGGV